MIAALILLSSIILFHEFGHFLLAKLNGVAVVEFSLGFGPRLLTHVSKKSGTRYSLKLLPLGGSCAMLGELEEDGDETAKDVGETDEKSGDDIPDWLTGCRFSDASVLGRIAIVAAGPIFNFILAFVFALVILSWAGYDSPQILGVAEGQAAEAAGIQAGDVITRIDGRRVDFARDITMAMMLNDGSAVDVQYKRYDQEADRWVKHETIVDPGAYASSGGRYYLGVHLNSMRSSVKSVPQLLKYGVCEVRYWICTVIDSLRMIAKGQVSGDEVAGPVRIVTMIDESVEENMQYGMVTVVMNLFNQMVMFSANLGVMNLLPIPGLDGGRLLFLFWELISRRPVNQRIEIAVNTAGLAFLMMLMVLIFFNDIRNVFL